MMNTHNNSIEHIMIVIFVFIGEALVMGLYLTIYLSYNVFSHITMIIREGQWSFI